MDAPHTENGGGPHGPGDDLWVFAYGSLMWQPELAFAEAQPATLGGYRRDMCFLSVRYRGTPARPGLVCGLMPRADAACRGLAYRVAAADAAVAALDARELVTGIYLPRALPLTLADGRVVAARTYVADTGHAQFVGSWSDARKAAAILAAAGSKGRAYDYFASLMAHLRDLAVADPHLEDLWAAVEGLRARGGVAGPG